MPVSQEKIDRFVRFLVDTFDQVPAPGDILEPHPGMQFPLNAAAGEFFVVRGVVEDYGYPSLMVMKPDGFNTYTFGIGHLKYYKFHHSGRNDKRALRRAENMAMARGAPLNQYKMIDLPDFETAELEVIDDDDI